MDERKPNRRPEPPSEELLERGWAALPESYRIPETCADAGRSARLLPAAGRDALREFPRGHLVSSQGFASALSRHLRVLSNLRRSWRRGGRHG